MVDERAELWPELCEAAERHLRLSTADLSELDAAIAAETAELLGAFRFPRLGDAATARGARSGPTPDAAAAEAAVGELWRDVARTGRFQFRKS